MKFFWLLLLFFPTSAWSFPELIREGYTNCTSCHFSPSGGGILTNYGRSLSKEVLSTWSKNGEERFLYVVKPQKWWALGGDFRFFNYWQTQGNASTNRYIPMERDLEGAVKVGRFTAVATVGYQDALGSDAAGFLSRRHFLAYQFDNNLTMRAGRFFPAFGLYIPEHETVIRRGLGWDQGNETYNVELSYLTDKYNFYATGILGRPDNPTLYREQGGAASAAVQLSDSSKLGVSYYYGASDLTSHHLMGPFAILGFTSDFFLLSQFTAERTYLAQNPDPLWGLVDYQKLGYEITQGLVVFFSQQFAQTNFSDGATRSDYYTLGLQFFPRPHFEIQTYWQKTLAANQVASDFYAVYLHFYP